MALMGAAASPNSLRPIPATTSADRALATVPESTSSPSIFFRTPVIPVLLQEPFPYGMRQKEKGSLGTFLNVLVCGASGFIGTAVVNVLRGRGHLVILGQRSRPHGGIWQPLDFNKDDK